MKVVALAVLAAMFLLRPCLAEDDVVRAVNAFGLTYQRSIPGNLLVSPWSIEQSLAMAYAGARGSTAAEVARALAWRGTPESTYESFRVLREALLQGSARPEGGLTLRLSTRVFLAQKFAPGATWRELVTRCYGSDTVQVDFSRGAETARAINGWANDATEGTIPAILDAGTLNPATMAILASAVHFHDRWAERFSRAQTEAFYLNRSSLKEVPLMQTKVPMGYARKEGFRVVALPYANGAFQFVAIVPDEIDGLAAMERQLTPQLLLECAALPKKEVRLWLPRLHLAPPRQDVRALLQRLGMITAFSAQADFSGMAEGVALNAILHQAVLDLDEDGVKAAAVVGSADALGEPAAQEPPVVTVYAHHPFVFLIQHVPTGLCVFMGRVTDPAPELPASAASLPFRLPVLR